MTANQEALIEIQLLQESQAKESLYFFQVITMTVTPACDIQRARGRCNSNFTRLFWEVTDFEQ